MMADRKTGSNRATLVADIQPNVIVAGRVLRSRLL